MCFPYNDLLDAVQKKTINDISVFYPSFTTLLIIEKAATAPFFYRDFNSLCTQELLSFIRLFLENQQGDRLVFTVQLQKT